MKQKALQKLFFAAPGVGSVSCNILYDLGSGVRIGCRRFLPWPSFGLRHGAKFLPERHVRLFIKHSYRRVSSARVLGPGYWHSFSTRLDSWLGRCFLFCSSTLRGPSPCRQIEGRRERARMNLLEIPAAATETNKYNFSVCVTLRRAWTHFKQLIQAGMGFTANKTL